MTEKRFIVNPSTILDDCFVIIDNEKKYTFPTLESTLNHMFCKALNELHEENEQLKSYTGEMEDYLARLEEKNEQLRKKIAKTEKIKQQRDFYYARLQRIIKIANGDFE